MAVPEASVTETPDGVVVDGDGWFVVNVADARGFRHGVAGAYIPFESQNARFSDFGVNIHILRPGEPNALYHHEPTQEDFLVLSGECLLLVEGTERRLRQWDFVHCPGGTEHVFVGAGDGPCAILMIGARPDRGATYPVSELAARYNASAAEATDSPQEAYEIWGPTELSPEKLPWPPA